MCADVARMVVEARQQVVDEGGLQGLVARRPQVHLGQQLVVHCCQLDTRQLGGRETKTAYLLCTNVNNLL